MFLDTSGLLCFHHRAEPQHAEAARGCEEAAFDEETGRVKDEAKLRAWHRQPRKSEEPRPAVPYEEALRRAEEALHQWMDLEKNQDLLLGDDVQAVYEHPEVRQIIQSCDGYNRELVEKLTKELKSLVSNRRNCHRARS